MASKSSSSCSAIKETLSVLLIRLLALIKQMFKRVGGLRKDIRLRIGLLPPDECSSRNFEWASACLQASFSCYFWVLGLPKDVILVFQ